MLRSAHPGGDSSLEQDNTFIQDPLSHRPRLRPLTLTTQYLPMSSMHIQNWILPNSQQNADTANILLSQCRQLRGREDVCFHCFERNIIRNWHVPARIIDILHQPEDSVYIVAGVLASQVFRVSEELKKRCGRWCAARLTHADELETIATTSSYVHVCSS
jgi:hypothetical protein